MNIDAKLLQESLAFLGLAVSKNTSDRPITRMLELHTADGFLVGMTCDELNFVKLKICPTTETLNALVEFELFNNVVKTCSGEIEIKEANNALSFKSSTMKCKIQSMHNRPNTSMPTIKMESCPNDTNFTNLSNILPICKSIIDPNFSINCYRYIYFGDKIMATDTDNVAIIDKKFFNEDLLLAYKSAEILSRLGTAKYGIITEEHKHTKKMFKKLFVQTDRVEFICISNYMDLFQYNDLSDLFKTPVDNIVVISKDILNKGYGVAKLFKNPNLTLVFDSDKVALQIDPLDFNYTVSNVGITGKKIIKASDELMKKILTLSGDITISILDNMIKCTTEAADEIFSVEEIAE